MARKITLGALTLSWHDRNGQWRKSIGFKPDKSGWRRVPAEFYFGSEEAGAFMAAQQKLVEWQAVCDAWESTKGSAALLFPQMDTSLPFWLPAPEETLAEAEHGVQNILARQPGNVTIEEAQKRYVAALRERLGLMGAKGLKQSTFNGVVDNLSGALASADDSGRRHLAPGKFVHTIQHGDVGAVINHLYRKGGLAERTALNYARGLQAFLDWMDNQPDLRFHKSKGMDGLFKLGKPETSPRVPTFEEVRKVYAACRSDAERLYVLLGINCGMYEADIAALTPAELVTHHRAACMWWRRAKTSHQNTFQTLHWLFPETLALIGKVRAPANEHGRLLLSTTGWPILHLRDGYRYKLISRLFPEVIESAGLKGRGLSFKSLRKFGAHEIRGQTKFDKDDMARKYLGQKIKGALRDYVLDDFDDLTEQLKGFRQRLIAKKVFPAGN